jgi:polyhydroxyalkanoate synthesis regulator phasin
MYKDLDKYANDWLDEQAKVLDELNKSYKDKFEDITKDIESTEKSVKSLTDEVAKLKQNLDNLTVDENKSIANEVLKARE